MGLALESSVYLIAFGHPNGDSRERYHMFQDGIESTEIDAQGVGGIENQDWTEDAAHYWRTCLVFTRPWVYSSAKKQTKKQRQRIGEGW